MPTLAKEGEGWYQQLSIKFADGSEKTFYLHFTRSGRHVPEPPREPAAWTKLDFHKCPGCPLSPQTPYCPAARSLEQTLAKLQGHSSVEVVQARAVDGAERVSEVNWPLQQVGSTFVQLAVFSSGCPIGDQLRPYVQDLRPFSTTFELIRHFVGRLLLRHRGDLVPSQAEIMTQIEPLERVFKHLVLRLTGTYSGDADAIPNSIVRMDAFAKLLALQLEQVCGQIAAESGWTPRPAPPPKKGFLARLKSLFG